MASLLISSVNLEEYTPVLHKALKGTYSVGWLLEFTDGAMYQVWGNSKDLAAAMKCAGEVFEKHGKRELLVSSKPVPKILSLQQVKEIRENGVRT